jgi:hypothetical protein
MSNPTAIIAAIREQLASTAGLPTIIWPNQEIKAPAPYMVFDDGFEAVSTITIDGEERYLIQPQVSLAVENGTHPQAYAGYVEAVRSAFKISTKITDDDGAEIAYCLRSPTVFNGRPDNGLYRKDIALQIVGDVTL